MTEHKNPISDEHQAYVDSLNSPGNVAAKAVYKMSKLAGYNLIKRMDAEYRARHDDLTGLLNKSAWKEQLEQEIRAAERSGKKVGILFIDLKDFKGVNDRFGHDIGDKVIIHAADVLRKTLRGGMGLNTEHMSHERLIQSEEKEVGRMGGDEFAIILDLSPRANKDTDLTPLDRLNAVATRVQEIFHSDPDVTATGVDVSIGGAVWEPGMTAKALLITADQNMYGHKTAQERDRGGSYR